MGEYVRTLDDRTGHDTVTGRSGVRLAVRTAGPADAPPVIFLHGWAQSSRSWAHQLTGGLADSYRLIAADLRGHGDSDVPASGYDSPAEWADDVAALLAHAGRPAVLVGWSYGGLVITDYLRRHGTEGVAGLAFVGAITEIGRGHPGGKVGRLMRAVQPAALAEDPEVAGAALREFVTGMPGSGARPSRFAESLVAESLRVPAKVRAALFDRDVASADVLASVDVPTLVLHGRQDEVVAPSAAEYTAGLVPGATLTWFDHTGHLPFAERADAFDAALAAHLDRCFPRAGGAT
ncbi:MAG TPA: alpha/beta hydrolase [Pseudonocardiaceae bacterium]|nr:alpha/beta hydrolase [Pseudonocardiaceae bacterium]